MSSQLADRLIFRYNKLETGMARHRSKMREIAQYFQPERSMNGGLEVLADDNREKIFDSTPEDALETLAAFIHSLLTPSTQMWSYVGLDGGEEGEQSTEVKEWLDIVSRKMSDKFNSEKLGFHSAVHEFYLDLPSFGTALFFVDEFEGQPRFECIPLDNVRISENARGMVDTVYRTVSMSARQLVEKWPDGVGTQIMQAFEKDPDMMFEILHVIEPRKKFKEKAIRGKDMPIASYYIELKTRKTLSESGYHEMPMMVARWSKVSGAVMGRGLGQKSLPDVRVLNAMNRSALIAGEKQADPATLLPHDGFIGDYSSDGGALNYYRGSGDMKDKVITMRSDADLNALQNIIEKRQNSIKKMWLNDKLQQVGGPQMTATEVIQVTKEKMNILGPVASRVQPEFQGPMMSRTFGIMLRNGEFPEPPEELQGMELKVHYVSPISRAQKQVEAEAFAQAMQYLAPIVQVQPSVLENFDFDEVARDSQALYGFPSKYLKDPKVVKGQRDAAAQAAAKAQQMKEASNVLTLAGQAKEAAPNEQAA